MAHKKQQNKSFTLRDPIIQIEKGWWFLYLSTHTHTHQLEHQSDKTLLYHTWSGVVLTKIAYQHRASQPATSSLRKYTHFVYLLYKMLKLILYRKTPQNRSHQILYYNTQEPIEVHLIYLAWLAQYCVTKVHTSQNVKNPIAAAKCFKEYVADVYAF